MTNSDLGFDILDSIWCRPGKNMAGLVQNWNTSKGFKNSNTVKTKVLILFVFFLINTIPGEAQKKGRVQQSLETFSGHHITFSEMDDFLEDQMQALQLPGLSIAIINDAKIVFHRVLGVTSIDTKEKVNKETLFDAGSLSKTAFTYLTMKMVEQGVLNLDTPLYTYLPYPDIEHDERYKLITARMVLSHTSGFPNWRWLEEDGQLDIRFTPGTNFGYSGEGFEYLADVIAHLKNITRNDLQGLFEKEVSNPLGMQVAYFTWNDYLVKHRASGHVNGKVAEGWGISADKPNFYASYSLQTEAVGYSKLLIAYMLETGLQTKSFEEILKPHVESPSQTDDHSWGLGIMIKPSKFGIEYKHNGSNKNFTSDYMFYKNQKSGYVFFTNCDKGPEFNKNLQVFLTEVE